MSFCLSHFHRGICALALLGCLFSASLAAGEKYDNWNAIATAMVGHLKAAGTAYEQGEAKTARDRVNDAYFGFYEKTGFERAVRTYISGKRSSEVEYKFGQIKSLMGKGADLGEVRSELEALSLLLKEDATVLDGDDSGGVGTLLASLLILLREGFEAILIIAAMAAYLVRSGNRDRLWVVYGSSLLAILASVLLAIALPRILNLSGANQEILEGATMFVAVVVLFIVSNWMFGKASGRAWQEYLDGKVKLAVAGGSAFGLGLAAFLAVFREGAETILFYQALFADNQIDRQMVWLGMLLAALGLVVVFILVRYGALVLPLKPFFLATSFLLFLMAISFTGGGVKEFQEADVISITTIEGMGTLEILGVYPTLETILPQLVLVGITILTILWTLRQRRRGKIAAASAAE
ncbi:MAG: FTR1 family protein [Planctomycetota bacterium]|jgi:high-affinity iron transporter|nr:FTR1 family protein [Planctomycetota bacterium]